MVLNVASRIYISHDTAFNCELYDECNLCKVEVIQRFVRNLTRTFPNIIDRPYFHPALVN